MIKASNTRAVVVCAFVWIAATAAAETRITIGANGVTAAGVTPGAEVVFFGRSVTDVGGVPWIRRHAFTERDADGDGVVTRAFEEMPQHSVWVAVDSESGQFATGASEGLRLNPITLPAHEWRHDDDAVDFVMRDYLDFLLVRPGKGAWTLRAFQGGMRDGDGLNDNSLRLRTSGMEALLGTDASPQRAVRKDVLVIIDPRTLEMAVVAAE